MKSRIENPYTTAELKDMFLKQLNKVPFQFEKKAAGKNGVDYVLSVSGGKIEDKFYDVWNDDYIVSFNKNSKKDGCGYSSKRFNTFDDFNNEICEAFDLVVTQPTFF